MLSVYKLSVMCYPNLSQCCEIHTFESSITITISYTVFCIYICEAIVDWLNLPAWSLLRLPVLKQEAF